MNIELINHVIPQKCKYKSDQIRMTPFTLVTNPYKVTQECISIGWVKRKISILAKTNKECLDVEERISFIKESFT